MKKRLIILIIFFIYYKTIISQGSGTQSIVECSDFEKIKENVCTSLHASTGKKCYYSEAENNCYEGFTSCSQINSDNQFTEAGCKKIILSDENKKCWPNGETCEEIDKECKDLSNSQCKSASISLNTREQKRCVLIDDEKCEEHYNSCTDNELNDATKCNNNIPSDIYKKCVWNGENCEEKDRTTCKDYINYSELKGNSIDCSLLKGTIDINAACYLDENKVCNEGYAHCEDVKDRFITKCEKIIPFNVNGHLEKCVLESEGCKTKLRSCEDYNKREGDTEATCELLSPEDENNIGKKMCFLNGTKCEEIYITCNDYNLVITNQDERRENICKSIIPRDNSKIIEPHYKCDFNYNQINKNCYRMPKTCNEINDPNICNEQNNIIYNFDGSTKKCVFKNNECIEEYKTCEDYKIVSTDNRQKTVCESITPIQNLGNTVTKFFKCSFIESEKQCKTELMNCEDYKGNDDAFCYKLTINLNSQDSLLFNCVMKNHKCVKDYKDCGKYKENNKTECESISLYNQPYHRCFLEDDNTCKKNGKLCSEYFGYDEDECSKYRASDDNKECVIENGKCIEKYKETKYKYCSDYRGTDESFCTNIQPYKLDDNNSPDYISKCIYGEMGCERVSIGCDAAKDSKECFTIKPANTDKMCVFINNRCVEQYNDCDLYEEKEEDINRDTCESIIIVGNNNEYAQKCVYIERNDGTKNECNNPVNNYRECKEFSINLIANQCSDIQPTNQTQKCILTNNICSSVDKTCIELKSLTGCNSDEDICKTMCESAEASSLEKVCVLKITEGSGSVPNTYGCEEVDRAKLEAKNKTQNKNNSGENAYIKKIIILLFCLLI